MVSNPFILIFASALGILNVQTAIGISCYRGTKQVSGSLLSVTSANISAVATLRENCNFCSLTRSSGSSPATTDAISWSCEITPTNGGCMKSVMKADTSRLNQYHCQCCEDNCNDGLRCADDMLTDAAAAGGRNGPAASGKMSCYNGTTQNPGALLSITSANLGKYASLVQNCDYCSITRSSTTTPVAYDAITWKCETFTANDGTNGTCFTHVMKAENDQMTQYTCKCCGDSCNNGDRCQDDGLKADTTAANSGAAAATGSGTTAAPKEASETTAAGGTGSNSNNNSPSLRSGGYNALIISFQMLIWCKF